MTPDLNRLLRPKSIAFFGGSWAKEAIAQTLKLGFKGDIWPVHPKGGEIDGLPVFSSINELPRVPDAAFVAVNRHDTIEIIGQLSSMGCGGAICFAAGFGESHDGKGLQDALICAANSMPIIGPNCYGLLNYGEGIALWPDQHGGALLKQGEKGVAIITQSSNIAINMTMNQRALPLSFVMTAGNQAQIGISQMALALLDDPRVSALGLHIEAFDDIKGFEKLAAHARAVQKPIVALKMGKSDAAIAATLSHTASLAGADAPSGAFLKRLGIARAHSIPVFLETLKLLHCFGPLAGTKISSMSCSGGEAALISDSAIGHDITFPCLSDEHANETRNSLGPLVAIANPLDYHTFIWNDLAAMQAAFGAFARNCFDLNLLIMDFPRSDRCSDKDWHNAVNAFAHATQENGSKGAILASLPENMSETWSQELLKRSIAPLHGFDDALAAIDLSAQIAKAWTKPWPQPLAAPLPQTSTPLPPQATALCEADAKDHLRNAGINVPEGYSVSSPQEALKKAKQIGFPVALKVQNIAHKSEVNGVRLGLNADGDILTNARQLLEISPDLLVEKMIPDPIGEMIIGMLYDPQFGPVLTIGAGGIFVELLQDSATLLLPTSRQEIEAALKGLKCYALFTGMRGREHGDIDSAIEQIEKCAAFCLQNSRTIIEMDINPLIICAKGYGAWAGDALILKDTTNE